MNDQPKKPSHRVTFVHRKDKTAKYDIFTGWPAQFGTNLSLSREYTNGKTGEVRPGVKSVIVTMDDGTVLDMADHWVNLEEIKARPY